jgi:uncharacterized protein (DUF433 family)
MAGTTSPNHERIVRDPKVLAGKPTVRGTRIPVELVLAKLAYNPDLDELFADFPRLTLDDVRACLEYAREAVARQGKGRRPIDAQVQPAPL